jgi:hypothetical protein
LKLKEAQFLAKEREQLTFDHDLKFNGGIIHAETTETSGNTTITEPQITGITLTQERQCGNLKTVSTKNSTTTSSRGAIRTNLTIKEQYTAQ